MEKTIDEKAYFLTGILTGSAITIFLFLAFKNFNKKFNKTNTEINKIGPIIKPIN